MHPASTEAESLRLNYERVRERIANAASRARRNPADIQVVAVSKTVAVERIRAAVEAGIRVLGENRVQEAEPKIAAAGDAEWHLVGPLQSNKARRAIEAFAVIESVGSVELAERLDGLAADRAAPYPVLLQVNVDGDPAKAGFVPEALEPAVERLNVLSHLEFRGLMTVGRLVDEPAAARPTFVALRRLSESLRAAWPRLGESLSMGMTDDFEIAVEEGATMVRVGRGIFGERPG